MERDDFEDAVSVLQRAHVLEACLDGPVDRPTIEQRAGCSRATAYRATSDLADRGLLERTPEGYRITGVGTAMVDRLRALQEDVDVIERLRPLLSHVDASTLAEYVPVFRDATVIEADSQTPYGIEQHIASILDDTGREIFGVASNVGSPVTVQGAYDRIVDGVEFEYVFTRSAFDRFTSQYGEINDEALNRANTAFYVADEIGLDFVVYDDTLILAGFDDNGHISAVATTDDPDALTWSRDRFEDLRRRSERVD